MKLLRPSSKLHRKACPRGNSLSQRSKRPKTSGQILNLYLLRMPSQRHRQRVKRRNQPVRSRTSMPIPLPKAKQKPRHSIRGTNSLQRLINFLMRTLKRARPMLRRHSLHSKTSISNSISQAKPTAHHRKYLSIHPLYSNPFSHHHLPKWLPPLPSRENHRPLQRLENRLTCKRLLPYRQERNRLLAEL